jgi:general L-amino acid transport system substrate-binding protein
MSAMTLAKRNVATRCRWFLASISLASAVGFASFQAIAGETLARVKSRQMLRCGVSDGRLGFSYQDAKGGWSGLDVDFCRAVAAAVVGDPGKVKYFPLVTTARFLALRSNEIDLLARNTTWTIGREAGLGLHFVGTLYYDGQGFMVARKSRVRKISDLQGAKICVLQKTTTEEHLADYFNARGWNYQPILANSMEEASKAFFAGQCLAYTGDRSDLAALRLSASTGREDYLILSELISKEPLGPAIKRGDEEWLTLLRWILFATIEAEERAVTSKNVRTKGQSQDPELAKFLDNQGTFAKLLGVKPGWVLRILEAVGNYGEMFERNLGQGSALKLDRGPNRLWTEGGLMYAPPFL